LGAFERPNILARGEPFDSLALSLSKGELAQDVPVEPRAKQLVLDKPVLSGTLILRQAQDERGVEGLRTSGVLSVNAPDERVPLSYAP